jgi:membrane protein
MDRLIRFGKDVVNGWLGAEAFTLAASLAYYAIFAIAPLLLISIHIASFFLDRSAATESLTNELTGVIGPSGSDAIKQMLDAAGTAEPQGWAGVIGLVVLLFAATGFVGSLQDALDKIWDAPPRAAGLWSFVRSKLFSFSLVLAAAFMLLVSLVVSALMTALASGITTTLGLPEGLVAAVIATANFLVSSVIFAAIFKFVPSVPVTWGAAVAGGVFTAVLFAAGRFALAWYLGREAEASAYGAATSLVLLLIWIYYSAQILFLGAQFSQSFQNWRLPRRANRMVGAEKSEDWKGIPPEKHFANVMAALGLGFLLGTAVTQPSGGRRKPGLLGRTSQLLSQLTR